MSINATVIGQYEAQWGEGPVWHDGHLLYETFMAGNERYARPRNPDFLLREGELQQLAEEHGLDVVAFSEGPVGEPPTAMRQRLCARRRPVA